MSGLGVALLAAAGLFIGFACGFMLCALLADGQARDRCHGCVRGEGEDRRGS
jgi:hypothetical protein